MELEKISVVIITLNEEKNVERCLKSVQWADEIVVLDSYSSDRTVTICKRFTERIFQEDWLGYGKQKNLAAQKASHRWVLNLDADEVISSECALEIKKELELGPRYPVYRFPRKNFFGNRWVIYGGWYPDWIFRFYDKDRVAFTETRVHESLVPIVEAGTFQQPIEHYSYQGLEDYIARQNHYSTLSARQKIEQGFVAGWVDLLIRPPMAFIKAYLFKQGFREGFLGFFLASTMAFYTFLKYAKTRSL